jgi:chromosome segregation ATPase
MKTSETTPLPRTIKEIPAESALGRLLANQVQATEAAQTARNELATLAAQERVLQVVVSSIRHDSPGEEIVAALIAERRLTLVRERITELQAVARRAEGDAKEWQGRFGAQWRDYEANLRRSKNPELGPETQAISRSHACQVLYGDAAPVAA